MNSNKTKFSISLVALLLSFSLQAQDQWSLERCIRYAQDNNLGIKQAQANVKTADLSERQAKAARYPNLSANYNAGRQFGRTIDRFTNTFSNVSNGYNSYGLSGGVNVYSGGQVNHSIKQAGWDLKAAEADATQSANTLALNVASAYLNVLLTEEQSKNAAKRVSQSREQLSATQKLIAAGSVPQADQYNIMAQIARDEQTQVLALNNVELAYLSLKQLLMLEPDFDLRIEQPTLGVPTDASPEVVMLTSLYDKAKNTQTNIIAADYRTKSARESIAIAKSGYYPSVSLGFNLNSNYSTAYQLPQNIVTETSGPVPVIINNNNSTIQYISQRGADFQKVKYLTQIEENFGQSVNLNVNIPIYQNGRTRLGVERAKLGLITSELQQNQAQQQLKNDIQTAIANARAGRKQYEASQKTFEATQIAYTNMEKRHTLGAVNSLDLVTAKNNRDIAENDLVISKYDYIFRLKILDFYEGKELLLK